LNENIDTNIERQNNYLSVNQAGDTHLMLQTIRSQKDLIANKMMSNKSVTNLSSKDIKSSRSHEKKEITPKKTSDSKHDRTKTDEVKKSNYESTTPNEKKRKFRNKIF